MPAFWRGIYSYAWFVGFLVAGLLYLEMMRGERAGVRVPH